MLEESWAVRCALAGGPQSIHVKSAAALGPFKECLQVRVQTSKEIWRAISWGLLPPHLPFILQWEFRVTVSESTRGSWWSQACSHMQPPMLLEGPDHMSFCHWWLQCWGRRVRTGLTCAHPSPSKPLTAPAVMLLLLWPHKNAPKSAGGAEQTVHQRWWAHRQMQITLCFPWILFSFFFFLQGPCLPCEQPEVQVVSSWSLCFLLPISSADACSCWLLLLLSLQ